MKRSLVIGLFLLVVVAGGVTFSQFFVTGSFFETSTCEYEVLRSPENQTYESISEAKSDAVQYIDENFDKSTVEAENIVEAMDYRMNDGVVEYRNPDLICGRVN